MELYNEILAQAIGKDVMRVVIPHLQIHAADIVDQQCYQALQRIKAAIENDDLSEFDCIEEIVCTLEALGSDGGNRHDF